VQYAACPAALSLFWERGAGYNSIPITLVGTVLHLKIFAGEWYLVGICGSVGYC